MDLTIRSLKLHPMNSDAINHVELFHSKFKSPYTPWQGPQIKFDHIALATLINEYRLASVLEIGTWKGYTSLMMWMISWVQRSKAIDIHKDVPIRGTYDHALHKIAGMHDYGIYFRNTPVQLCFADTMTYEPDEGEQHDLIFIDANHDYEHVKNDTKLAMRMNPKIIAWHDYEASNPGVVQFMNELLDNGSDIVGFQGSICTAAIPANIKI